MNDFIQPPGSGQPPTAAPPTAQINVNPKDMEDVKCECGNFTFQEVILLKHMPALISPTGKEGYVPMKAFSCVVCNQIPPGLLTGLSGWFKSDDPPAPQISDDKIEGSKLPGLEIVLPGDSDGEGK